MNENSDAAQPVTSDDGFGMVEIVVSLFMLGVLSVAFLPLLIQGLQLSAQNATRATATQILQDRMEYSRTYSTSCAALVSALETTAVSTTQDPRGISFQVVTDVGTCPAPAALPSTVSITVTVRRTDDLTAVPLATATSLLFVKTA